MLEPFSSPLVCSSCLSSLAALLLLLCFFFRIPSVRCSLLSSSSWSGTHLFVLPLSILFLQFIQPAGLHIRHV